VLLECLLTCVVGAGECGGEESEDGWTLIAGLLPMKALL
jgi:hypothetical protein